jgi:hypothetical protein
VKALINVLNWAEWISALIGVVFLLLVAISTVMKTVILGNHLAYLFQAADSFFLLAILLFLFIHFGQFKKE